MFFYLLKTLKIVIKQIIQSQYTFNNIRQWDQKYLASWSKKDHYFWGDQNTSVLLPFGNTDYGNNIGPQCAEGR